MKTQIDAKKLRERLETAPLVLAAEARLVRARQGLAQAQTDYNEAVERLRLQSLGKTDVEAVASRLLDEVGDDQLDASEIGRLQLKVGEWQTAVRYCAQVLVSTRSDMAGQLVSEIEPAVKRVREELVATYFAAAVKVREAIELAQALRTAGVEVELPLFGGSMTGGDQYNSSLFTWANNLVERGLIGRSALPEWRRVDQ